MSKEYNLMQDTVWPGIKTGSAAAGLTMLLLLPTAWLMYTGRIPMQNLSLIGGATTFLACLISTVILTGKKREGRGILPLITVFTCTIVLLIMTAALPSCHWKPSSVLITSAFELAGAELGMMTNTVGNHRPGKKKPKRKYK